MTCEGVRNVNLILDATVDQLIIMFKLCFKPTVAYGFIIKFICKTVVMFNQSSFVYFTTIKKQVQITYTNHARWHLCLCSFGLGVE